MPAAAQTSACPEAYRGFMPPRLAVGMVGEIQAGGTPNRVRSGPSREAPFLFNLDPGTQFPILNGPVCGDGIVWWVVAADGRVGWTAELNTTDGFYYLQPAPDDAQNVDPEVLRAELLADWTAI